MRLNTTSPPDFLSFKPEWLKRIPANLKLSMCATYIIGIIAHLFCYTNVFFNHDAAGLSWEYFTLADAATGSRWLIPLWDMLVMRIQLPWLEGLLTLTFYGLSAWLVCEVLEIRRPLPVILVCGLMVASPTAISSNLYLSSAHDYAIALLAACASIYCFEKVKRGWIWAFVFLVISAGTYGAYVSVSVSLFLVVSITRFLFGRALGFKEELKRHVGYLSVFIGSMGATVLIISLILKAASTPMQGRVANAVSVSFSYLLNGVRDAYVAACCYFLPVGNLSFFQQQRFLYALFILVTAAAAVFIIFLFVRNKLIKSPLNALICCFDFICLPLALNIIGAFYYSHTLMQFAFVLPWLFYIQLYETARADGELMATVRSQSKKALALSAGGLMVVALSASTIVNGVLLANASYMKSYAIYETAISLTNRIVDHVEGLEGYEPGVTKVLFVGSPRKNYAPYRAGFKITESLTGIGCPWWDTSLTYNYPLAAYINQQLGVNMALLTRYDIVDAEGSKKILEEQGCSVGGDYVDNIKQLPCFPSRDCYYMQDDVVVFKLGD